jgi:MFS family permease
VTAPTDNRLTIAAGILLITLVGVSLSLFIPLLGIEMERMGVSGTLSGFMTALGGIGTLTVAPFVPRLAARFGIVRIAMTAIASNMVVTLAFHALPFAAWIPLRLMFGAAVGTLFVVSEYWITAAAPPERRGMVMGIYATMLAIGFAAGPVILKFTGTIGLAPYVAGASIYALAAVPLLLVGARVPQVSGEAHAPAFRYMLAIPVATAAGLVFGAIETGAFALFPAYGLRQGIDEVTAALLISVVTAGNIVSQVPLGWLSDRVDRRLLLLACSVFGVAGALMMPLLIGNLPLFYAALLLWGGATGGLYTIGLAHLGAKFRGAELANANAAFVMLYSAGSIVGPMLVGRSMDVIGVNGFAFALAGMLGAYACLVGLRLMQRADG